MGEWLSEVSVFDDVFIWSFSDEFDVSDGDSISLYSSCSLEFESVHSSIYCDFLFVMNDVIAFGYKLSN